MAAKNRGLAGNSRFGDDGVVTSLGTHGKPAETDREKTDAMKTLILIAALALSGCSGYQMTASDYAMMQSTSAAIQQATIEYSASTNYPVHCPPHVLKEGCM